MKIKAVELAPLVRGMMERLGLVGGFRARTPSGEEALGWVGKPGDGDDVQVDLSIADAESITNAPHIDPEGLAIMVYLRFLASDRGTFRAWVAGGNSLKQLEARAFASRLISESAAFAERASREGIVGGWSESHDDWGSFAKPEKG